MKNQREKHPVFTSIVLIIFVISIFIMSRNATASWSGYGHQGNVGLLVALKKINELGAGNLDGYVMDYENQEDVRILNNGTAEEVHQVKAKINADTKGLYTGALSDFEPCNGRNCLHTICEIRDWDELTDEQKNNIERYKYEEGVYHCELNNIKGYIDAEIKTLLEKAGHAQSGNTPYRTQLKDTFLGCLDEKIRTEHRTKAKVDYDVNFTLDEVYEIIHDNQVGYNARLCAIRQDFSLAFRDFLEELDDNGVEIDTVVEEECERYLDTVYCLSDDEFLQFLININPHTTSDADFSDSLTTDKFFVGENFRYLFIDAYRKIRNTRINPNKLSELIYNKNSSYLLTTLRSNGYERTTARKVLNNKRFLEGKFEVDFIISDSNSEYLDVLANKLIEKKEDKTNSPKRIKFISKDDAINDLN